MYEAFYGFRTRPFGPTPEEAFLYPSRQHRMALDLLAYGLRQDATLSVVCGDIGTGKTTVVRHLLGGLDERHVAALVTGVPGPFAALLPWIVLGFGLEPGAEDQFARQRMLAELFERETRDGRRCILVIDEAQVLEQDALDELRLLGNLNAGGRTLVRIVLVGQLALRDTLRRPECRQIAQRVGVDYLLSPLDREQTRGYIQHRLRVAGGREECIGLDACDAVFAASRGVPRIVNLVCDTALAYGYADERDAIDAPLIEQMMSDKAREGGWLFQPPPATSLIPVAGSAR